MDTVDLGPRRYPPNSKRCTKRVRFIGNLIVVIIILLGLTSVTLALIIVTQN